MSLSARASWIDICKGFGIILVIFGHAIYTEEYRFLIYAFHMPLFFFLSGLTFRYEKYQQNFPLLLKKTTKMILLPYVLFALLSYVIWAIENGTSVGGVFSHLQGIIYGNSSSLFFNVVLWFLPCLFLTKIAFTFLTKFVKKKYSLLASLFGFSLIGYFVSVLPYKMRLPFGAEVVLTSIVFFGLGAIWMRHYHENITPRLKRYAAPLLLGAICLNIIFASINYFLSSQQIDLRINHLGNYFLFYLAAFTGIIGMVIISKLIKKHTVLEYLGRYSLILFAVHPLIFPYLTDGIKLFVNDKTFKEQHDWYSPLYTIFSIGMILLLTFIVKKIPRVLPLYSFRRLT